MSTVLWGLSPRESQAVELLTEHGSAKGVGRAMGLSSKTVDILLARAMLKAGLFNRTRLAILWDRHRRVAP